jgi:hypothetical protein
MAYFRIAIENATLISSLTEVSADNNERLCRRVVGTFYLTRLNWRLDFVIVCESG